MVIGKPVGDRSVPGDAFVSGDSGLLLTLTEYPTQLGECNASMMSNSGDLTVGIVTLGLIGGSLALALQRRGVRVVVWDRNPVTRAAARSEDLHVVDELEQFANFDLDLIVVASPLVAMPEIMQQLAGVVSTKTTITDAGSVKERVRAAVEAAGLSTQYVGAHPMAGTEKSGFAHATADLFSGATWAVTLAPDSEFRRVALVLQFITDLLGGRVLVTDDLTHDDSVALISHLPHVLSHALTATVAGAPHMELALKLAAGSFRDTTRVARGSASRNEAMVRENSRAVREALGSALEHLARVYDALGDSFESDREVADAESLTGFFNGGAVVVEQGGLVPNNIATTSLGSPEQFGERNLHLAQPWAPLLLDAGRQGFVVAGVRWTDEADCDQTESPVAGLIVRLTP